MKNKNNQTLVHKKENVNNFQIRLWDINLVII